MTPATMTGPPAALRRAARLRRGSRGCGAPPATAGRVSARCAGQASVTIFEELERLLPVLGELVGHQLGEAVEVDVLGLDHVHEARQLGGEVGGLRRRVGARRRDTVADARRAACASRRMASATSACTSMVSTRRRSISLTAGGRSSVVGAERAGGRRGPTAASGPPRPRRSAGCAAAASRARRPAARKASCMARAARRVGSSSVTSGSSSGSAARAAWRRQVAVQDRARRGFEKRPPRRHGEDARAAERRHRRVRPKRCQATSSLSIHLSASVKRFRRADVHPQSVEAHAVQPAACRSRVPQLVERERALAARRRTSADARSRRR